MVCLDTITKAWARTALPGDPIHVIPGFFMLAYVENTGIAFGMFQGYGELFSILSPIAFVFLGVALGWHVWRAGLISVGLACGMIIGGALGNVWSRLTDGYVVDFLDFYIGQHHWPTFNVADSALCCGVVLFLLLSHHGADAHEAMESEESARTNEPV